MRIQKYLSQQGMFSRREAEEYIKRGLIKLNGKVVTVMGVQMDPTKDRVEIMSSRNSSIDKKITVLVYKSRGIVCSRNSNEGKTIFEAFPQYKELNVVGRLDKDSEGLLLLSNDGVITAVMTGEGHFVEKEYEVTVRENISDVLLKIIEKGIVLDDKKTLPVRTRKIGPHKFSIIIREGRHHQIRRMADFIHLTIERLARVRIGTLTSAGLSSSESRLLNQKEVAEIKNLRPHDLRL